MNNFCIECQQELKTSQYARIKTEDSLSKASDEHFVCRNYPRCKISEKDVD